MATEWTPERFAFVDWDGLASQSDARDCADYAATVRVWSEAEQDSDRKEALGIVWALVSLHITWNAPDRTPLQPSDVLNGLPRDALAALAGVLDRITALELRTRIADAAWCRGRACSPQIAIQCAHEYFELARSRYVPDDWVTSFSYLRRAVDLAAQLARKQELFRELSNSALEMLRESAPNEPLYFSLRVIELLLGYGVGDPVELAEIAEAIADRVESTGDVFRSRDYLEGAARCWERAKRPDRRTRALRRVAGLFEQQAALHRSSPEGAIAGAMCLDQAVEVYRRAGGGAADVERLNPNCSARARRAWRR
jgi:hypothetical protein